jgi:hypothetical protein
MFIPVTVEGRPAKYGFDTGMDLSVMSEKEARRLGLECQIATGSEFLDGASGKLTGFRFVVARRLSLGGFELKNVVFLLAGDGAPPFAELPPDRQGIVGFPVLRTLDSMRRDRNGILRIGFSSEGRNYRPNLCVPGNSSPVAEGLFRSMKINVLLDTGSGRTLLTPRFSKDSPDVIGTTPHEEVTRLRGLGGVPRRWK